MKALASTLVLDCYIYIYIYNIFSVPLYYSQEYIHRVGRTARAGARGRALLFLLPEEVAFLRYLRHAKVTIAIIKLECFVITKQ